MLARECAPENAGVAGYTKAFRCVLSGKQTSIQSRYLRTAILGLSEPKAKLELNEQNYLFGPLTPSPGIILAFPKQYPHISVSR